MGCIPGKMRNQIALNLLTTSQLVGSGKIRYYNDENKERKKDTKVFPTVELVSLEEAKGPCR